MRIAQVAPLIESVPPKNYGGTERVVSYLTEELVRLGEEVFLFASGDSATQAKLIPCCKESLRTCRDCEDQLAHHFIMMNRVYDQFHEFDVVHWHIDYLHYPMSKMLDYTHITTLHGRLDIPNWFPSMNSFRIFRWFRSRTVRDSPCLMRILSPPFIMVCRWNCMI